MFDTEWELRLRFSLRGLFWAAAYAGVVVLSLWLRSAILITAVESGADDYLFIRLASYLREGQWLGPYDEVTLVKGIAYPAFIAASFAAGISLKFAEQAFYLAAAALAAWLVCRLAGNRWIAFILFVCLALNPTLWAQEFSRVLREGIYVSLSLALVAVAAIAAFPRETGIDRMHWRAAVFVALGLVSGAFWLTREEGIWIVPAVAVFVVAAVLRQWRAAADAVTFAKALFGGGVMAMFAVLLFAIVVGGVAWQNWRIYGTFEINEFKSPPFRAAYGAISRIHHDVWRRYVVFPRDARERAYGVSPAVLELRPYLEGPESDFWRSFGCGLWKETCGEIASPWFIWAVRWAAAHAGHHVSATEAAAFYRRLAAEVNAACAAGRISCLPERATLAPPFRWHYLSDSIASVPQISATLLNFGDGRIGATPSRGAPSTLIRFVQMAGKIAGDDLYPSRRLGIERALAHAASLAAPILVAIACFGLVMAPLFAKLRRSRAGLFVLLLACAVALMSQLTLLTYIDATSFPAGVYVSAASPLLIAFIVLGCYAAGLAFREALSSVMVFAGPARR